MTNANNNTIKSWIAVNASSDFPIQNIPFGIAKTKNGQPFVASIIGDTVINLAELNKNNFFSAIKINNEIFNTNTLNNFIELGKATTNAVRERIIEIFTEGNTELQSKKELHQLILIPNNQVEMLMPIKVGDYTDFYSSIDHATNMGKMFRDPENALLPNWKHIPVGYHGRASSIVVSGTNFHRPKGQTKPADSDVPVFGPSKLMDFELETAFVVGKNTSLGKSISTANAKEYIFGMALFNDWSARDIQSWEYVPLGPFLAKNFASTISPWIVTMEALEPFRVKGYEQTPKILPYLEYTGDNNIDINLEVFIQPENAEPTKICTSNYKFMYWTMEQQLAHHTVNGCNVNVGDLMASGTISGPTEGSFGSMMEITWRGTKPIKMNDGTERKFINDNDTVIVKGYSEKNGVRIGFGSCEGKLLPAL